MKIERTCDDKFAKLQKKLQTETKLRWKIMMTLKLTKIVKPPTKKSTETDLSTNPAKVQSN